ncbi:Zn-dependent hydrolase [Nonomuraea sp. NPDC050691]|uniref:Zn-dependent hydrolase n=1 Tax=Nonomuraea sp. NPDC050691 TaxID=3155661 RepID=UPI0033CC9D0F
MPGTAVADSARVAELIERIATISDDSPGVTRLAFTPAERKAHSLFAGLMSELGLRVWTDAAGNTMAEAAGAEELPAIGTGSHLDSVPRGGRFDGIAGVVAAVEVARIFTENQVRHRHPFRFVAFAAEEGARFGQACLGSRLAAGLTSPADLRRLKDAHGTTVAEAMKMVGLDPDRVAEARWDPADWAAFVELHVEQGGMLEATGLPIGVVDTVSGSTRMRIHLNGRPSHTGATPMAGRADALTTAARVVLAVESIATDARHHGTRATVGEMSVRPGSLTTIPGEVVLTVDVRDVDAVRQRHTAAEIVRYAETVGAERGVRVETTLIGDSSPVVLPLWVGDTLAKAAVDCSAGFRMMTSGASHDAQMINKVTPTGMIFVPSRAGVSHVPEEWTAPEDLAVGVQVLARSLLSLDALLSPEERSR